MKNEIIEKSILGLQKEGLRFSIDTIAKEMHISKKTVYKNFSCKEDLAIAIYEKFYDDIDKRLNEDFSDSCNCVFANMLSLYYQSYNMIREDLFNKFSLNNSIKTLALNKHSAFREKFKEHIPGDDSEDIMLIIEGTFEKLNGTLLTQGLIKRLERIL